ncbi:hypothetical protein MHI18_00805 [Peribacillus sp. FSL H8-0477]|uniref:hypothetical protein n=1 Tax=Peribacillus sp. FSL H8-0477 TaxID=2921388 RepID=UPI0030FCCA5B
MNNREIIIEIDKITSGKNNIISFVRNNEQINFPPLTLKPYSTISEYNYNHHFDKEDLIKLNKQYPSIHPNDTNENINIWAKNIKAAFKQLIQTGDFDRTYNYHGDKVSVKYIWVK